MVLGKGTATVFHKTTGTTILTCPITHPHPLQLLLLVASASAAA
jgi:hypothetical protein